MSADLDAIFAAVESHALTLGRFERVNMTEPKSKPIGGGITCAIWVDWMGPVLSSGLAATSGVLRFNVRVYQNMIAEPQDAIDPAVTAAVNALFAAYAGDFTLDGLIRNVDLRGMAGVPLSAQAGYINQDNSMLRVVTITLPLIINDMWDEEA